MKQLLLTILLLFLCACSLFSSSSGDDPLIEDAKSAPLTDRLLPPPTKSAPSSVQIQELPDPKAALDDIEILWKIPESPVDGFLIQYGNSKENLDQEIKISSDDVEKLDHPKYGPTYRYLLHGFSKNEKIFVAVSAISDTLVSSPSEVFEVK